MWVMHAHALRPRATCTEPKIKSKSSILKLTFCLINKNRKKRCKDVKTPKSDPHIAT